MWECDGCHRVVGITYFATDDMDGEEFCAACMNDAGIPIADGE